MLTLCIAAATLTTAQAQTRPADSVIVAKLVEALKDPDLEVRQNLGAALARLPIEAVGPLMAALKDANPARRAGAAYALGLIGDPAASSALPGLLDALSDPELEVRRQASQAVARIVTPRVVRRTTLKPIVNRP